MVDAIDTERCDAIAAEVMEKPAERIRSENQNTKMKIVSISVDFFSKGQAVVNSSFSGAFKQLPTNFYGINMLEDGIKRDKEKISQSITRMDKPFDKIETLVIITVDGNEVFRENKTFDQLNLTVEKEAS